MKVGSFVICVDDSNWSTDAHQNFNKLPVKGQLYIVSKIHPNYASKEGPPGVSVEGIVGKIHTIKTYWGQRLSIEWHFKISRFKEIDLLSNSVALIKETEIEEHVIETDAELIE
jgi:hypothetical protein